MALLDPFIHKAKHKEFYATSLGVIFGLTISFMISIYLLPLGVVLGALGYIYIDAPRSIKLEKEAILKEEQAKKEARVKEERAQEEAKLLALEAIKEEKRLAKELKATQKRNRMDKSSLYENIYTVAGFILSNQVDLSAYSKNAEEVISYFKCTLEERRIAVEAFNNALAPDFDASVFVEDYLTNYGKTRDYIEYVLTYAYMIATIDDNIDYLAKDRLADIGLAMGASKACLKRLFKSNAAEAKFAREFEKNEKEKLDKEKSKKTSSKNTDSKSQDNSYKNTDNNSRDNSNKEQNDSYSFKHTDKTSEALDILGVDDNATFEDIKKAYKRLMIKFHPDKLASQGLPEDMMAIYTDKAKSIQGAFEHLKKLFDKLK